MLTARKRWKRAEGTRLELMTSGLPTRSPNETTGIRHADCRRGDGHADHVQYVPMTVRAITARVVGFLTRPFGRDALLRPATT